MADSIQIDQSADRVRIILPDRLDARTVSPAWAKTMAAVERSQQTIVEAESLSYCDGSGMAFLLEIQKRCPGKTEISGLEERISKLFESSKEAIKKEPIPPPKAPQGLAEKTGHFAYLFWLDLREQITFTGKLSVMLLSAITHPAKVRWHDMWLTVEKAGLHALGIVGMIGFLVGLIMAFQSAMGLRPFGVDIFVVNIVALAMVRELGPIMTAVVLAGRSGSSFAAELGTMKVNEELNALSTMGIDQVRFLVIPRTIAGIIVTPLLTVYANFLGVAGAFVVMMGLGYPFSALWKQVLSVLSWDDIVSGMIKAVVFGLVVAGIGCLRGMQTASGPSAVGDSTTRAVVSGIVLIVLIDAIFAVLFYAIDF